MTHPLVDRVAAAVKLVDAKNYEEALPLLLELRRELEAHGMPTAFISYHVAVCADMLGEDPELAVDAILAAIAQDPTNCYFENSRDILAQRLEERIVAATGDDRAFLYRLLVRLERVRTAASLKFAEWCIDNDRLDVAKRIVFASTVCEVGNPFAGELGARLTVACGASWLTEIEASFGVARIEVPTPKGMVN